MRYIFTLLFLLSSFGFAEDEVDLSYLKAPLETDDPNTLYVLTSIDSDCETSKKQLDKIVKGSLIRSRIKPTDEYTEPLLSVHLGCMDIGHNNPYYFIITTFGHYDYDRKIPVFSYYDYDRKTPVLFSSQYNKFGIGDKQVIETAIKDRVDEAMEDYIQANFMDD